MNPQIGRECRGVVLVTDGEQRGALAVVRSLGAAGYRVIVVSSRSRSLAGVSRFAHRHVAVPSALTESGGFLAGVEAAVRTHSVDVIVPITEHSLLTILGSRDRFAGVTIPFVSLDQFRAISDKALLLETAREVGFAIPEQRTLVAAGPLEIEEGSLLFPVVLKPARSVVATTTGGLKLGVSHAASWTELIEALRAFPAAAYPILVQQRIVGPGIGVFLLVWNGTTIATFGHRRIREKPPAGGVSVSCEAMVPEPSLVARARALLDRFAWQGVAMVECKVDQSTGVPYLMEVNGRFWGSLQLAISAGVDFPRLLVECAQGGVVSAPAPFRAPIRNRWEWGEVDHLLARLRRSAKELALPAGSPSRGRAVLDFLTWRQGDHFEVFRPADPSPFLRESLDWFRGR